MMSCALPSAVLSDYLADRAQSFVNVLALSKPKLENCQIASQETSYVQALISVSNHMEVLMKNSMVVAPAFALPDSALPSEKMKQFLESVSSVEAIQPWTVVLRMRDFLEATVSNFLTQSFASSKTFAASQVQACKTLMEEELLKKLPEAMSPAEMEQLRGIFTTVLQYELAMLESSLAKKGISVPELAKQSKSPWHPSNILFTTDFDITCTQVDSCYALVVAAEVAAGERPSPRKIAAEKLLEEYESILVRHAERQKATFLSFQSEGKEGDAPTYWRDQELTQDQFLSGMDPSLQAMVKSFRNGMVIPEEEKTGPYNEAGLRKALIKLAKLEVLCNEDVMASGVLSGSTRDEIRVEAKKVLLRPNCAEVLHRLFQLGTAIHVVSANWSRDLIIGGLPDLPREKLFVHCNDLLFDQAGASEGIIDMTVVDAFDKEKTLRVLRSLPTQTTVIGGESDESFAGQQGGEKMLVYLGDSHTDLLGLLEADLGIVIGESPLLRRVLSLYDIQLLPLSEATAHIAVARMCGSKWSCRRSGVLFEAQGWTDVEACLFGQGELSTDSQLMSKIESLIDEVRSQQQSAQFDDRIRDLAPLTSLDMIKVSS